MAFANCGFRHITRRAPVKESPAWTGQRHQCPLSGSGDRGDTVPSAAVAKGAAAGMKKPRRGGAESAERRRSRLTALRSKTAVEAKRFRAADFEGNCCPAPTPLAFLGGRQIAADGQSPTCRTRWVDRLMHRGSAVSANGAAALYSTPRRQPAGSGRSPARPWGL
jgi:hypothetical protein